MHQEGGNAKKIGSVMVAYVFMASVIPNVDLIVQGINYASSMGAWMKLIAKEIMIVQILTGVPKVAVCLT